MTKVTITEDYLENIADAIRSKNGSSNTYTPAQMAPAIQAIPTGGGGGGVSSLKVTSIMSSSSATASISASSYTVMSCSAHSNATNVRPNATTKPIRMEVVFLFSKSALGDFLISIFLVYFPYLSDVKIVNYL